MNEFFKLIQLIYTCVASDEGSQAVVDNGQQDRKPDNMDVKPKREFDNFLLVFAEFQRICRLSNNPEIPQI